MVSGPDDYLTPLNPAVALGGIMQQVFHGETKGLERIYIYLPFPLIGGIIAVLFHEFIYKRVQEQIKETEEHDGIIDKEDTEDVLGQKTYVQ